MKKGKKLKVNYFFSLKLGLVRAFELSKGLNCALKQRQDFRN